MSLAFIIWLCGGLPAIVLALECWPTSVVQWITAVALVVFWPVALFAFFVALIWYPDTAFWGSDR